MNSTCGNNKKIHVGEADMVSLAFGMIAFWIKQHKKCTRRRMHSRPLLVVYCGRIYNCSILDVSPFILIYMTVRTLVESTWNRCFSKRNKMIRILRSILEFMSILTFTICIWYVWIREPIEMVFAELPNMPSQIHTHTHTRTRCKWAVLCYFSCIWQQQPYPPPAQYTYIHTSLALQP